MKRKVSPTSDHYKEVMGDWIKTKEKSKTLHDYMFEIFIKKRLDIIPNEDMCVYYDCEDGFMTDKEEEFINHKRFKTLESILNDLDGTETDNNC